jgi:SpoVK/Ycf46/Vps4 family AAA+-type ATPase
MAADSSVIDAISAAVTASPGNTKLRLHLAELLLDANRAAEALEHCQKVLAAEPDNISARPLAARAAEALGKAEKAPSNVVPLRVVEGGLSEGPWTAETTKLKLADVAGMEQVKRRLNLAFLAPLRNPEMMKMYGKTLRGGLMLYGPPGCGKTFIARATAGEMGARFVSVGLADVLDMYLGQSERNLHEIFETARRNAPCVLFFDEIDALGRKRSQMRNSAGREAVNQLLAELDSVGSENRGVFVLAATNHPWDVDSALRRPGRLDRTLLVLPPDAPAREAILRYHVSGKPVEALDLASLAAKTEGYSGADLAHLCESAAELAMEESMASGKARPLNQADFKKALKDVKPSTRPWFETARNYAMFANEGGTYDELLDYLRTARMV